MPLKCFKLQKVKKSVLPCTKKERNSEAALIVTIVFAGAITVPRGNDGQIGKPRYVTEPRFIIFAVTDAITLYIMSGRERHESC